MPEQLILWAPPVVNSNPEDPNFVCQLHRWVEKCAKVGVSKIIDGSARTIPLDNRRWALTEACIK